MELNKDQDYYINKIPNIQQAILVIINQMDFVENNLKMEKYMKVYKLKILKGNFYNG